MLTYDEILEKVDGKAFRRRLFFLFFYNGIPNALMMTAIIFIQFSPSDYRCAMPEAVEKLVSENPALTNATLDYFIPIEVSNGERSKCYIYNRPRVNDTVNFFNNSANPNFLSDEAQNATKVTCAGRHVFTNPYGIKSVATEFDWTCESTWKKPIATTAYWIGMTLGSLSGFLSDKFGRRPVFIGATFLQFFAMILLSFSVSTWMYGIAMFFCGGTSLINFIAGFVLGTESTTPDQRNFLSISSFISFSLGYGITSFIAYFVTDWRWLLRICGACVVLYIPNIWMTIESPRWLIAKGRLEEAAKILNKIAKYNSKNIETENLLEDVEKMSEELIKMEHENSNSKNTSMYSTFLKILKTPAMLGITIIIGFSWFSVTLVYYGISLSVQTLSGNLYLNNTLMGLVELPGLAVIYAATKYISRPISHGGLMVVDGLCCLCAALVNSVNPEVATAIGLVGKGLNAGIFFLVYIHTTEVFPTIARNTSMSACSLIGRVGSILSPSFVYLGETYSMYLPYLLMSLITITSGILTFCFIPDTRLAELPENVEDSLALKPIFRKCFEKRRERQSIRDLELTQDNSKI